MLDWVAFPISRGFSQPRDRTQISRIVGGFFTNRATREAHISIRLASNPECTNTRTQRKTEICYYKFPVCYTAFLLALEKVFIFVLAWFPIQLDVSDMQVIMELCCFNNPFFSDDLFFGLHWVPIAARGSSLVVVSQGCSLLAVHRLLLVLAFHVAEPRL